MNTIVHLAEKWRSDADRYERDQALVRGDAILRRVAAELEAAWREWQDDALTLQEATAESGYCRSSLEKKLESGEIRNAGRKHRPRIRRRDLPVKVKQPDAKPDIADRILKGP